MPPDLLNNLGDYLKDRYYSTIFLNYGDKNILKFVSDKLFSNIFEIVYNFELNTTKKTNHRDAYINSNIYHKGFDESISDLENIIIDETIMHNIEKKVCFFFLAKFRVI